MSKSFLPVARAPYDGQVLFAAIEGKIGKPTTVINFRSGRICFWRMNESTGGEQAHLLSFLQRAVGSFDLKFPDSYVSIGRWDDAPNTSTRYLRVELWHREET